MLTRTAVSPIPLSVASSASVLLPRSRMQLCLVPAEPVQPSLTGARAMCADAHKWTESVDLLFASTPTLVCVMATPQALADVVRKAVRMVTHALCGRWTMALPRLHIRTQSCRLRSILYNPVRSPAYGLGRAAGFDSPVDLTASYVFTAAPEVRGSVSNPRAVAPAPAIL